MSAVTQNSGTIIIDSTAPVVDLTSAAGLNYTVTSSLLDEVSGIYLQSGRSVTEVNNAIANVKVAVSGLEHATY